MQTRGSKKFHAEKEGHGSLDHGQNTAGEVEDVEDTTSYKCTWRDVDECIEGKYCWSGPPPIEGEWHDDIKMFDEDSHQMVSLPPGYAPVTLPSNDLGW